MEKDICADIHSHGILQALGTTHLKPTNGDKRELEQRLSRELPAPRGTFTCPLDGDAWASVCTKGRADGGGARSKHPLGSPAISLLILVTALDSVPSPDAPPHPPCIAPRVAAGMQSEKTHTLSHPQTLRLETKLPDPPAPGGDTCLVPDPEESSSGGRREVGSALLAPPKPPQGGGGGGDRTPPPRHMGVPEAEGTPIHALNVHVGPWVPKPVRVPHSTW